MSVRVFLRASVLLLLGALVFPTSAAAQESRIAAEFRREREHFAESCTSTKTLMGCAMLIATGKPLHLSFGSIAPGNGVALGASFGTRHNPNETWRLAWSADAVRSVGGSWRAGAYMRMIYVDVPEIVVVTDPAEASSAAELATRPHTVINLFAETTSLQRLSFYQPAAPDSRASFGMQQTIVGTGIIAPVTNSRLARRLNVSVIGEIAGRWVSLRDGTADDVPGIFSTYDDQTAPGLDSQPAALVFGAGARFKPAMGRYLQLNYLANAQWYVGGDAGAFSFTRWKLDLDHDIAFYGTSRPIETRDTNTPNDCLTSPTSDACPPVSISRNKRGSLHLRVLGITSATSGDSRVPFYFQPTLGGQDINGQATLASFADYRFRGPHLLLFQQTFEHSVWGPVGAWLRTDQGMVADERNGINLSGLRKSVAFGATIRAGGLPMIVASYAVGGGEGRHFSFTTNTSLLGGSSRPSLD